MRPRYLTLGALGACLTLAGCSNEGQRDEVPATTSETASATVAATVAASPNHRRLTAALTDTQLAPVLDGKGIYTLLAPGDAAFSALGTKAKTLEGAERRPLMIAVLRAHLLPGEITPEAIERAIARKKAPVTMRTMAGATVRFRRSENGLIVDNGATQAKLAEPASHASNGTVLPIDAVLLPANSDQ